MYLGITESLVRVLYCTKWPIHRIHLLEDYFLDHALMGIQEFSRIFDKYPVGGYNTEKNLNSCRLPGTYESRTICSFRLLSFHVMIPVIRSTVSVPERNSNAFSKFMILTYISSFEYRNSLDESALLQSNIESALEDLHMFYFQMSSTTFLLVY